MIPTKYRIVQGERQERRPQRLRRRQRLRRLQGILGRHRQLQRRSTNLQTQLWNRLFLPQVVHTSTEDEDCSEEESTDENDSSSAGESSRSGDAYDSEDDSPFLAQPDQSVDVSPDARKQHAA